jgi:soluble lytic murein transglycosylase-like protein
MRWLCLIAAWSAAGQTPDPFQASIQRQRASTELQRKSVQRQLDMAKRYRHILPPLVTPPPPAPAMQADCPALPDTTIAPIVEDASRAQDVPEKLLRAVIQQESGFKPCAISSRGALGLMQLMPATAGQFGARDPLDPKQNVDAGAKFLKQLLTRFKGDLPQALGAYNAGVNNVQESGAIPDIPETRNYVDSILKMIGVAPTPIPHPQPVSPTTRPDPQAVP